MPLDTTNRHMLHHYEDAIMIACRGEISHKSPVPRQPRFAYLTVNPAMNVGDYSYYICGPSHDYMIEKMVALYAAMYISPSKKPLVVTISGGKTYELSNDFSFTDNICVSGVKPIHSHVAGVTHNGNLSALTNFGKHVHMVAYNEAMAEAKYTALKKQYDDLTERFAKLRVIYEQISSNHSALITGIRDGIDAGISDLNGSKND